MFSLSRSSVLNLGGVHPDLARVVYRAIKITSVDFKVTEGLRNLERQRKMVKTGASQTMNSRHLTGHAVDLAAIEDGKARYDWPLYFPIARAMGQAAHELGVKMDWGGCGWGLAGHRRIDEEEVFSDTEKFHYEYIKASLAAGRKPMIDGPHFQLSRMMYP